MTESTYESLAAPFDVTFTDVRGGVEITYISGEQVISRLNEVLGVAHWSFRVIKEEIHAEADEAWCLGEIAAVINGETVIKQQFGSQKIKRSRSTGVPLDLGFDLKGAGTDAMKKCASMLGVGLYLSHKRPQQRQAQRSAGPPRQIAPSAQRPASASQAARPAAQVSPILCRFVLDEATGEICHKALEAVADSGRLWTASELANHGQTEFKKPLCWDHYCESQLKKAS